MSFQGLPQGDCPAGLHSGDMGGKHAMTSRVTKLPPTLIYLLPTSVGARTSIQMQGCLWF